MAVDEETKKGELHVTVVIIAKPIAKGQTLLVMSHVCHFSNRARACDQRAESLWNSSIQEKTAGSSSYVSGAEVRLEDSDRPTVKMHRREFQTRFFCICVVLRKNDGL